MSQEQDTKPKEPVQQEQGKPNERMGFEFSSAIKIFDPETQEVFVQARVD
jgi:hypothetical protein